MPRVLIVAIGNPLRCDDGLAWQAADQLEKVLGSQDVSILKVHQLMPEVAEAAGDASLSIFVDASAEGSPGEVHCVAIEPVPQQSNFTHHMTPSGILALASMLYGNKTQAVLVSLTGKAFGHGDSLSAEVIAALPQLVGRVTQIAGDFLRDGSLGSLAHY